jgi:hypothetical protein
MGIHSLTLFGFNGLQHYHIASLSFAFFAASDSRSVTLSEVEERCCGFVVGIGVVVLLEVEERACAFLVDFWDVVFLDVGGAVGLFSSFMAVLIFVVSFVRRRGEGNCRRDKSHKSTNGMMKTFQVHFYHRIERAFKGEV